MLKYLLISVVFLPVLFGVLASASPDLAAGRRTLRVRWILFGVFWIALLHFLRSWWV